MKIKAIILAAGQSKRLWPITHNKPKCLLTFGKKTIIDLQMKTLTDNNINDVIVVVGFQAEKLMRHLKKQHPNVRFTFIMNKKYADTYPAYGLWLARKYLTNTIIYLNADVLFDPRIVKKIVQEDIASITAIQRVPWDEEEVNVILGKDLQVLEIGKYVAEHLSCGEFIGVTKIGTSFNKELVKVLRGFIQKKEYKKFAADALNLTIQHGQKMYAIDVTNFPAIEIDTPEDFINAKKLWKKHAKVYK